MPKKKRNTAGKPKAGGSDSARSSGDFSRARSSEDFSSEIAAILLHKAADYVRTDPKEEPGRTDEDGGSERARCGGEGEQEDGMGRDAEEEQPPADWMKSKAEWDWETARRSRVARVSQKIQEFGKRFAVADKDQKGDREEDDRNSEDLDVHSHVAVMDGKNGEDCLEGGDRKGGRVKPPKYPEVAVNAAFRGGGRTSLTVPGMKGVGELGLLTLPAAGPAGSHTPRGITTRVAGTGCGQKSESAATEVHISEGDEGQGGRGGDSAAKAAVCILPPAHGSSSASHAMPLARLRPAEAALDLASPSTPLATPRGGRANDNSPLTCPLCAGEYTAGGNFCPKILKCFHSTCAACVLDLQRYKGPLRRCPVCHDDVGIDELFDNFVVLDLLEAQQIAKGRDRACSNDCIGEDATATHYCEQCGFLCQFCVSMHTRQRVFLEHILVTMDQVQREAAEATKGRRRSSMSLRHNAPQKCEKHHDQSRDLFCSSCNVDLCSKCALLEHPPPAHVLQGVEELFAISAIEIYSLTDRSNAAAEQLEASKNRIQQMRQLLQSDADEARREIEKCRKQLIEYARVKAEEALEAVAHELEGKDSELEGTEHHLSNMISALQQVRDFALAALETSSKNQVIKIKSQLVARLLQACQTSGEHQELSLQSPHRLKATAADLVVAIKLLIDWQSGADKGNQRESAGTEWKLLQRQGDGETWGGTSNGLGRDRDEGIETEAEEMRLPARNVEQLRLEGHTLKSENQIPSKAALETLQEAVVTETALRVSLEQRLAALKQDCEDQTDHIVSLESDLRLAVKARDSASEKEAEEMLLLAREVEQLRFEGHTLKSENEIHVQKFSLEESSRKSLEHEIAFLHENAARDFKVQAELKEELKLAKASLGEKVQMREAEANARHIVAVEELHLQSKAALETFQKALAAETALRVSLEQQLAALKQDCALKSENQILSKAALETLQEAVVTETALRVSLEQRLAALKQDCEDQTDHIVSLESDLRLAVKARDSAESDLRAAVDSLRESRLSVDSLRESLEHSKESAVVSELQRIISLEADNSKLKRLLEAERASAHQMLQCKLVLELELKQKIEKESAGGRCVTEQQVAEIVEELEAVADGWKYKYCDVCLKGEALCNVMNNVKHLANLMCCELDECSFIFAEATRLWQGEPLCSSAKGEALCSTGKTEHQENLSHAEGVEEEQEEREGGGDKEQGDTRAQLQPLPPSQLQPLPSSPGAQYFSGAGGQYPLSPPSLPPDVTARLFAEMTSARRKSSIRHSQLQPAGGGVAGGGGGAGEGGRGPMAAGTWWSEEQLLELELKALHAEYASAKDKWHREREGLLEDLLETPCKGSPTQNMQTNGDMQHAKEFWMLRNEFASAERRWEKELDHLQNQFQMLELELKALHMDYDSAKDRWQRECEGSLKDSLATTCKRSATHNMQTNRDIQDTKESEAYNCGGRRDLGSRTGISVVDSTTGILVVDSTAEGGQDSKAIRNEYASAQRRWDKEREDMQNQLRNVLQACMEAEREAEKACKREAALQAALEADNRDSSSKQVAEEHGGNDMLLVSCTASPDALTSEYRQSTQGGRLTLSSPEMSWEGRKSAVFDLPVEVILQSPDLHSQRQTHIPGRKHGGAFSRKIVEEMVEKMELQTATLAPGKCLSVGKLKEQLPEQPDTDDDKNVDWV